MLILGIDPGSLHTGYGIIRCEKQKLLPIAQGVIHAKGESLSERLYFIFEKLCDIIAQYQPTQIAIEEVFMKINVQSALKLGQARGAALIAAAKYALPVHEYSARIIKKTVSGYGAADKLQVQYMVKQQLQWHDALQVDAADALAIAICHSCHQRTRIATELTR